MKTNLKLLKFSFVICFLALAPGLPKLFSTANANTSIPSWTMNECGRVRTAQAQSRCATDLTRRRQSEICTNYDNPHRSDCESSVARIGSYDPISAINQSNQRGSIPGWTANDCGRHRDAQAQSNCAAALTRSRQQQCTNLDNPERSNCESSIARTGSYTAPATTPRTAQTNPRTATQEENKNGQQPAAGGQGQQGNDSSGNNSEGSGGNNSAAATPPGGTPPAEGSSDCQPSANGQPRICFKNPFPEAQSVGNHAALSGTDAFVDCNSQSAQSWGQVTTDRNQNTSQIWSGAWSQLGKKTAQEVNGIADAGQAAQKLDQAVKEAKDMYAKLMSCEAYRSLTAGGSFSSQQGGDRRQGSAKKEKKSADGQITCKSCGEETQDFEPCVKAANAYDAALVGQAAFSGYQQISNMDKTLDAQTNLDPNNPTSGISAQANVLRHQGNLATQQAAVDAGKTGLFFSMWSAMPDAETVEKRCVDDAMRGRLRANDLAQDLEKFVAEARRAAAQAQQQLRNADTTQIATAARREIQQACRKTLAGSCVINNSEAKDKMKQAAIMAGIEAFVNMGKAALLARQANRLDKLVDEVEAFDPTSLNYNPEDYFGSQCELNPMAEGCDNFVSQRSFGFGDGGPIQIHGLTQATTFDRGESFNDGSDSAVIPSNPSREDVPRPVGAFDPGSKGPTGFVGNTPGAAEIKEGGGNLAGGGGGGGVGSAGSPPGGPGGAGGAGAAPQMARPTGATANGYGGGTGSIRLGGGYGAQGSRGADAGTDNPFGDLFGGKNPQGALDFRDPASQGDIASKDASIFSIITNRYGIVQQSDRLLEYERD